MRLAPCRVLVADPPWPLGDKLPGKSRGAVKNYPLLSIDRLKAFPLPPVLDDSLLLLWRVASMQQEALDVMSAWGFVQKTELVWIKKTKFGKRWFGMGRTFRAEHETCLVGWRGRPTIHDKGIRSTFEAPAGEHSQKPDEFFRIAERLIGGPYTELFSRARRPGWQCLGNEVDGRLENPGSQVSSIPSASRLILPGEELQLPGDTGCMADDQGDCVLHDEADPRCLRNARLHD